MNQKKDNAQSHHDSGRGRQSPGPGKESELSGWKQPYVIYLGATLLLLGFLLLMGYLALENDWIPKRGI